jgi:Spy/CpxP family protein refolding chaperone
VTKSIRLLLARFSIASFMALALAGAVFAQSMDGPGPMGMHPRLDDMHGGMHGERLRHLGLTEAQQDQIFKIYHDQAPEMRERMKAIRRAHEALRQSAKALPFDRDRARQLADTEAKAVAQIAFMRVETMSRVRAVLTEEQRAKLDAGRDDWRGRRGPR